MQSMNAINVIAPYKWMGMWVFDDARVGLDKEPFVAGADTLIDHIVADIPDAANGFVLIFSGTPFPGHQHRFDWLRTDDDGGNWYFSEEFVMARLALPSVVQILRRKAPKQIYVQAKQRTDKRP